MKDDKTNVGQVNILESTRVQNNQGNSKILAQIVVEEKKELTEEIQCIEGENEW